MQYETAPGFVLDLAGASPADIKYLNVLQTLAFHPGTTHAALIAAIYSLSNPLFAQSTPAPGTGIVSADALKNPVYLAMCDVLYRFELRACGRTMVDVAQRYTVSVSDAGKALGMTPDAVRKAIHERRLAAWRRFLPDPSQGNQWSKWRLRSQRHHAKLQRPQRFAKPAKLLAFRKPPPLRLSIAPCAHGSSGKKKATDACIPDYSSCL